MNVDRPPSDPLLQALGGAEDEQQKHARAVEAAVDAEDVDRLASLLEKSREEAQAMLSQLRPPDEAAREAWLDRWEGERKVVRPLFPRRNALIAGLSAAAAAVLGVLLIPPRTLAVPELSPEIISRPAEHLSGSTATSAVPEGPVHREVAGDIVRIALTADSMNAIPKEALEVAACWTGSRALWRASLEREDDRHATVSVQIPEDVSGEGELRLIVAGESELSSEDKVLAACLRPREDSKWRVVNVLPPIAVERNRPRKEKGSP